ncbi:cytochrome C oxidase subunit IV family protein [Herminiimonas sp. CN]|uniref:cytochrome C oxidase subunit IV family protein n=1 Tax=Herminiimonas sp. CN TaxID=1349818 RepID=UPI0004741F44|nr:cytochrome C oxidase subunit IV family protein [Herminiimonas sp. CN]
MSNIKKATFQWASLLLLTGVTFGMAGYGLSGRALIIPVLLVTLLKGRIVIDRFMALQDVAGPWRWIVLGWLVLVLGLIGFAFRA